MKTIFDCKATPYELTLITGTAMTKKFYLNSDRNKEQKRKDLFRLMLIRRNKKEAWHYLEIMDPHDAEELKEKELTFL